MQIDWKQKYKEIKLKFKDTVDLAFRLGVEEGMRQGQVQQAQQAQADAQAQAAAGGQSGQDPNAPGGDMPGQEQSDGSELDQHIGTLEGMLSQAKPGTPEQAGLQKSLHGIKEYQSNIKQKYELKKAEQAIAAIGKALKPKFTFSNSATKNMSEHGKKALNDQEKIVENMMKSFAEEEAKATETINKTLSFEQVLKG